MLTTEELYYLLTRYLEEDKESDRYTVETIYVLLAEYIKTKERVRDGELVKVGREVLESLLCEHQHYSNR